MALSEPWQIAEVPGPRKALVITKPEVVAAMIKKAKSPILIVGHKAAEIDFEEGKLIDFLIEFSKKSGIPIVATAHAVSEFLKRNFKPAAFMPAVDIANRLADKSWKGVDGKGQHDLALIVGLYYYMEWVILSGLKNFAPNLKTITLDNVYHPNASWSFPNIAHDEWVKNLKVIAEKI
ncbi:MAG: CO dehydrogenase/acetyl-CoA synthase complex subunit epsilon [Candidatus Bathyarchaeia archaeon]